MENGVKSSHWGLDRSGVNPGSIVMSAGSSDATGEGEEKAEKIGVSVLADCVHLSVVSAKRALRATGTGA
jgi:hypothetical protein